MGALPKRGPHPTGAVHATLSVVTSLHRPADGGLDVDYACETKIGPKNAVSPVDIKAVKSGGGYT
ncbi:hypothetical protein ABZ318_37650, partial [Streptomyces sp. NPDC006197]